MKTILLIYANTGGGHLSAARAINEAFQLRHPGEYNVRLLDIAEATGSRCVRFLYNCYNLMLKADSRYAKGGKALLDAINIESLVRPLVPLGFRNLKRALENEQPDIIVSVHGIVNTALIGAMKELGWYGRIPYQIICTDLTDNFLKGWANPGADRYIVFSDLAREQMIDYKAPSEKVTIVNGFPVSPAFFQSRPTREAARAQLGLSGEKFTVLLTMGGMAVPQKTLAVTSALLESKLPLHLLAVCGNNGSLCQSMEKIARKYPDSMTVFAFTPLAPLMAAADLLIAKPGPGTIMEAVISELPMLLDAVTEPMPQECGNLRFVLREGIGEQFTSYAELPKQVERQMRDARAHQQMRARMHAIKNEDAIFEIADLIAMELHPSAPIPH